MEGSFFARRVARLFILKSKNTSPRSTAVQASGRAIIRRTFGADLIDRKSTRLNSSHVSISYAVFCLTPRHTTSTLFPYTTLFRSGNYVTLTRRRPFTLTIENGGIVFRPASGTPFYPEVKEYVASFNRRPSFRPSDYPANLWSRSYRSEEHTSELQSRFDIVCRLLLDTSTHDIYTLSLHDALPIWKLRHTDKAPSLYAHD